VWLQKAVEVAGCCGLGGDWLLWSWLVECGNVGKVREEEKRVLRLLTAVDSISGGKWIIGRIDGWMPMHRYHRW
jgi:hypothetical protein